MIVTGSLQRVKSIMLKHGVEMIPGDFSRNGYLFSVNEEGVGNSQLVKELERSRDVIALSYSFASDPV